MLTKLYADGTIEGGEKLAPKSAVVNVKRRAENQKLTDFYKVLERNDIVEFKRGVGYFAKTDYQTALNLIDGGER
jgi:DNA-binding transcriptional regulator YhcF (GntR family)